MTPRNIISLTEDTSDCEGFLSVHKKKYAALPFYFAKIARGHFLNGFLSLGM
jgi:hypothetical protein